MAHPLPFEVTLPVLQSRAGEPLIRDIFEPLGYSLTIDRLPLDPQFPDWRASRYSSVTLTWKQRLQDLLGHLTVLIPVLDDEKHYWVGDDEVDKLLRRGGDWLPVHPARWAKGAKGLALPSLSEQESLLLRLTDSCQISPHSKPVLNPIKIGMAA